MKTFLTALVLIAGVSVLAAQDLASVTTYRTSKKANATANLPMSRQAAFPGGSNACAAFFNNHLVYPQTAQEQYLEGLVVVEFTITEAGNIQHIQVVESLSEECDQEAIRLVQSMPNWTPAVRQGALKATRIRMPILFQMK